MRKRIWTEEQTKFLIENYEQKKTNELLLVLKDKTNDQIRWKAKEYNLTKKVTKSKKNISFLEELSPLSCYWWGFLTADGCFNKKQIILSISYEDVDHLEKFSNITNTKIHKVFKINEWNPNGYTMGRIAINDAFTIPRLLNRFSIINNKTKNPFDITEFLLKDNLIYFIAGFIDGDGHIDNTNKTIRIKIDPSWSDNLNLISNSLMAHYSIKSSVWTHSEGWAVLQISAKGGKILKDLLKDSVPFMERKWNRI